MNLSRQQNIIVTILRDKQWHCGREWLDQIKDDRIRITELNRGYMKEKGWEIRGEPCKGLVCGKSYCPLYKRRAEKIGTVTLQKPIQSSLWIKGVGRMLEYN